MNIAVQKISEMCEASTRQAVAKKLKISESLLSLILSGQREVSESVAGSVGLKRLVIYIPDNGQNQEMLESYLSHFTHAPEGGKSSVS
jgi:hypothetical protein